MNKTKANRIVLYSLLALFVPLGLYLYHLTEDLRTEDERAKPKLFYDIPERAPMVFDDGPEPERVERRATAITGRVFTASGGPLIGARVILGKEIATVDREGRFRFEPAVRPRVGRVRVVTGAAEPGEEIVQFTGVVTGDLSVGTDGLLVGTDGATSESPRLEYAGYVPPQPMRFRWSIYTPDAAPGADGTSLPPTSPESADGFVILHDAILWENWGLGGRAHVSGRTNLPDGASVFSSVKFDTYPVAACLDAAVVKEGRWQGVVIGKADVRTYSGEFEVGASFNSLLEDPSAVLSWSKLHPNIDFRALNEVVVTRDVFLGEEEQEQAEDRETEEYIRDVLGRARRFRDGLKSRVDQIRLLGKGWAPSFLAARREALVGWFHEELIDEEGLLDTKAWRTFLDDRWRPALSAYLAEHRRRGVGKYREAFDRAEQLLTAILQMSRVYSLFVVYPQFGLPPHDSDFYFDERGEDDLTLLRSIVEEQLDRLQRFTDLKADAEKKKDEKKL